MKQLKIPAGTRVLIAPLQSDPPIDQLDQLVDLIASYEGVSEAHLTQCFALGVMENPAPVLTLIVKDAAQTERVLRHLVAGTTSFDMAVDIWVLRPNDPVVQTVRQARSRIYPRQA